MRDTKLNHMCVALINEDKAGYWRTKLAYWRTQGNATAITWCNTRVRRFSMLARWARQRGLEAGN